MSLWLVHALLVALTLLLLLKALVGRQPKSPDKDRYRCRELLENRFAEIEGECSAGLIVPEERDRARREAELLYSTLVDDDASGEKLTAPPVAAVGASLLVLAAAVFYFAYSDGYRMLLLERQVNEVAATFESLIESLRLHLGKQPGDTEARLRLADAYYLVGDHANAVEQYHLANESGALEDSEQWLNYADALLRSGNVRQADVVIGALNKILGSEADNQRALFISAFLHFERGEYPRAIELWQHLLSLLSPDEAGLSATLREFISRAEAETAPADTGEAQVGRVITVTVSLVEALRPLASPEDTVFVYARAVGGSPAPIAIRRLTVADLPARITLSDGDSMMQGMALSRFDRVEVVARVSKGGQAATAPGDLIGVLSAVTVGESVTLDIAETVD